MAGRATVKATTKRVRPIMSTDFCEARRRSLGLYRAFYRYIPYIVKYFDIPKSREQVRDKVREYFYRNACVTDVRVIDTLVLKETAVLTAESHKQYKLAIEKKFKGYMELKEIDHQWQQKGHVMAHWFPTAEPTPHDFVGKFLAGID